MYNSFFGFSERPFQLVPNPAYLFLSRSHEEAQAHLTYAVSQGDGFVEITGEVGTGKTTLCRVFLDKLDESIEAAYIFNPMLNSIQLLQAINDEFGISSTADNTKELIDKLNVFLMEKKAQGKKAILLIDEAQNLNFEVLEQLRLLSNLETTTSKLLQIILVGQPELREKLDSHELRQLGQRITLSCHLTPLNFQETRDYIQHRIRIASQKTGTPFTRSAVGVIYKYSRGIPRLTNIACDRALLTAYGLNKRKINSSIAKAAIRELTSRGDIKRSSFNDGKHALLLLSFLCLALMLFLLYPPSIDLTSLFKPSESKTAQNSTFVIAANRAKAVKSVPAATTTTTLPIEQPSKVQKPDKSEYEGKIIHGLGDYLKTMNPTGSRHTALKIALDFWNTEIVINQDLEKIENDQTFFRLGSKQNGLLIFRSAGTLDLLRNLNLPAILEFKTNENHPPGYLTLSKIVGEKITFGTGNENEVIEALPNELNQYWLGAAYILWKDFYNYEGAIKGKMSDDSLITLKMLIKNIGFNEIQITPIYDEQTRKIVETIQQKNSIPVDGIVGPLTKIILYNEIKLFKIPHIVQ